MSCRVENHNWMEKGRKWWCVCGQNIFRQRLCNSPEGYLTDVCLIKKGYRNLGLRYLREVEFSFILGLIWCEISFLWTVKSFCWRDIWCLEVKLEIDNKLRVSCLIFLLILYYSSSLGGRKEREKVAGLFILVSWCVQFRKKFHFSNTTPHHDIFTWITIEQQVSAVATGHY